MMMEKKLAPEMKVMTRVRARIRGACFRREGNIGCLAPYTSQKQKAMMRNVPRRRGTSTCAPFHEYWAVLVLVVIAIWRVLPDSRPIACQP